MKKIIPLLLTIALVFVSCETEPLNNDDVNGVDARGKVKKEKVQTESSSYDDCMVNLLPDLPAVVNACTTAKGEDANNSYFDLTISDTFLAGDYSAWCTDQDASLGAPECFIADVYSSYDALPPGKFEKPENFDLVNWLYNQDIIGQPSSGGDLFTFGDFQRALWYLIDDSNCVLCEFLGDWDEDRALELVAMAEANGEGYEPGAGDKLAVILIPTDGQQSVFIPYTLECEPEPECETAFARGDDGNTCFSDTPEEFSRWGWTIGPLAVGDHGPYEIWAAAGQCDTSKGELVGHVTVSYGADGVVDFDYTIIEGYTLSEVHEYAGNAMFPIKNGNPTVAPGQYTIADDLEGDIYVIWHAGVCN
jgi:hypothetical protein